MAYLLRLLTRRDYAEAELDERLRRKGAPDEVRAVALERLRELELIDDARVAEALVRAGAHRKGRLALRRDLRSRGVDDATVDAALRPLDDDHQVSAAREVLRKEAWRFASGDRRKDRAKAAGFLRRRGFDGDAVGAALETALDADGVDADGSDAA